MSIGDYEHFDLQAALAARIGMAAFAHVWVAWLDQADPGPAERFDAAQRELKKLL